MRARMLQAMLQEFGWEVLEQPACSQSRLGQSLLATPLWQQAHLKETAKGWRKRCLLSRRPDHLPFSSYYNAVLV
jgi:hypothetical protein